MQVVKGKAGPLLALIIGIAGASLTLPSWAQDADPLPGPYTYHEPTHPSVLNDSGTLTPSSGLHAPSLHQPLQQPILGQPLQPPSGMLRAQPVAVQPQPSYTAPAGSLQTALPPAPPTPPTYIPPAPAMATYTPVAHAAPLPLTAPSNGLPPLPPDLVRAQSSTSLSGLLQPGAAQVPPAPANSYIPPSASQVLAQPVQAPMSLSNAKLSVQDISTTGSPAYGAPVAAVTVPVAAPVPAPAYVPVPPPPAPMPASMPMAYAPQTLPPTPVPPPPAPTPILSPTSSVPVSASAPAPVPVAAEEPILPEPMPSSLEDAKLRESELKNTPKDMPPSPALPPASQPLADNKMAPSPEAEPSIRPETVRAWSEDMEILERENRALRERLQIESNDPLKDIKVDAVGQIHEDVLRARVVELEKELDKLRMKGSAGNLDLPQKGGSLNTFSLPAKSP